MTAKKYLLADQPSELGRLQLQSRVWEQAGRQFLSKIEDGPGARALDLGCGALGWLRILSEWVGSSGEVVGTDFRRLVRPGGSLVLEEWDLGSWHFNPAFPQPRAHPIALGDLCHVGGEAGRELPELLREIGVEKPEIDAHVVALDPAIRTYFCRFSSAARSNRACSRR